MTLDALPVIRATDLPVATAAQMAEADRIASEELGIPLEVLMENAARQVAVATRLFLDGVDGKRIVAVCGTGNNGGDALAVLRHLAGWGATVEAYVAGERERLRPLAALQHDILTRLGVPIHLSTAIEQRELVRLFSDTDALVVGLLGYNVKGAPRGEAARLIEAVSASARPGRVVAVDLPSGLEPDTGANMSGAPTGTIPASLTVTLALPKPGLLAPEARQWVGQLVLADIGIPAGAYRGAGIDARRLFARGDLLRVAF